MSITATGKFGSGAGFTGGSASITFPDGAPPKPGDYFRRNDATGAEKRFVIVWVETYASGAIECGCEGPLPPPPPPPSHPT